MVQGDDLDRCPRGNPNRIIRLLMKQVETLEARVRAQDIRIAELEARLNEPSKNSSNSSVPPSKGWEQRKNRHRQGGSEGASTRQS
jgi:hypothetical protein